MGGYTAIEVAEEFEKMIQYNVHTNSQTTLKSFYNLCVTRVGNILTITRLQGNSSIGRLKNGVVDAGATSTVVQFATYGLQDLYISAKGMRDTDLQISFNQIKNWLFNQFNLGLDAPTSTSIRMDDHFTMINGT